MSRNKVKSSLLVAIILVVIGILVLPKPKPAQAMIEYKCRYFVYDRDTQTYSLISNGTIRFWLNNELIEEDIGPDGYAHVWIDSADPDIWGATEVPARDWVRIKTPFGQGEDILFPGTVTTGEFYCDGP